MMSILAEATPPQGAEGLLGQMMLAALCLGVSVPLVVRLVWRGPLDPGERLPPGGSVWPLVLALAWGLIVWMAVPAVYVALRGPALRAEAAPATQSTQPATAAATAPSSAPTTTQILKPASPPDGPLDLASLNPRDVAFLSAVPHLVALLALVAFDLTIYGPNLLVLGFAQWQARSGLAAGSKLALVFVPLVFGGAILTEWLYQSVGYEHPTEHALLRVLGKSAEPIVRVTLAIGAVVIAPLSEELLFRGHAQTIVRNVLARFSARTMEVPPAWATWGAILFSSAVFAGIHDPWTWPPIFLLSVCLGWAYERTGNLWAPVGIHAAFNAVSTLIFLATAGSN